MNIKLFILSISLFIAGCGGSGDPAPKGESGTFYLVLADDHTKVAGTIENGDTTLSLRWPNKVWSDGSVYRTKAPRVVLSDGVLGILATAKDSTSGMTAYYGLDVVDANGNEVFATSCDSKHQCFGMGCRSCVLTITDCNGSCDCEEELATDGSYCEHAVSTMTGEDLEGFALLDAIFKGCSSQTLK